jgi:hypothetical protein
MGPHAQPHLLGVHCLALLMSKVTHRYPCTSMPAWRALPLLVLHHNLSTLALSNSTPAERPHHIPCSLTCLVCTASLLMSTRSAASDQNTFSVVCRQPGLNLGLPAPPHLLGVHCLAADEHQVCRF